MTNQNHASVSSIEPTPDRYRYRPSLLDVLTILCVIGIPVLAVSLGLTLRAIFG